MMYNILLFLNHINYIFLSKFESAMVKQPKQLKELYNFVKKWDGKGKNLVFVTHYSIITAITNAVPSSGEISINW